MTDASLRNVKKGRVSLIALLLVVSSAVSQSPPFTGGFDGIIIDQRGMPAANAKIHLVLEDYNPQIYEGPGPNALKRVTTSDAEGHFVFDNLPDGKYKIQAYLPGMFGVRTGSVYQGSRRVLEMDVEPAARLSGRVVDSAGKPVAGAEVYPSASSRQNEIPKNWQVLWRTTSDSDGRFTLDPVYKDVWRVTVRAKGYAPAVSPEIQPDTTDSTIVLTQGATVELRAVPQGTSGAVGGIPVSLRSREPLELVYRGVTDEQGCARLENVTPGVYAVVLKHERYIIADDGMRVTVDASPSPIRVELPLARAASLSGRIFDANTGNGLSGVDVWSNSSRATSGEDGTYTLAGLRDGPLEFHVATPEHYVAVPENNSILITLQPGEAVTGHDFGYYKGVSIEGVVVTGDGKGVADAYVNAFGDSISKSVQTDGEGRFSLSGFTTGSTFRVSAVAGDEWVSEKLAEVQIPDGGVHGLQIKVVAAASISGRASLSPGEPVRDGHVYARLRGDSQSNYSAHTGPGGLFQFPVVAPGTYELSITRNRTYGYMGEAPDTVVTVGPGDDLKDVVVQMISTGAGVVAGRVFDADGKPIAGAQVTLQHLGHPGMQQDPPYLEAQSDFDGGFRFAALPDGDCIVSAFKEGLTFSHSTRVPVGTEDARIEMQPAPQIEGSVTWCETGEPVTRFAVAYHDSYPGSVPEEFGGRPEFGDAKGRFSWTASHVGDAYLLVAAPGSTVAVAVVPNLGPGETRSGVEVALERGCSLRGRVVDREGNPLPDTNVQLTTGRESQGIPMWQAFTQKDGAFWFPSVSREQHLLILGNRSVSEFPRKVYVAYSDEKETVTDFVLDPDGAVLVLVESREPLPPLMAWCQSMSNEQISVRTENQDQQGNLLIKGVPPGRYLVLVSDHFNDDPSRAFAIREVDVLPGMTSPVRITLRPAARDPQKARSD